MCHTLSKREHAPFRYDIVGSFLRPESLKEARAAFEQNKITTEQLKEVEDACIRDLVEKQLELGLKSVTDGELRRSYWHLDFMWGFNGIEHNTMSQGYLFHGVETRPDSARVYDKIKFTHHPFLDHFKFLKSVVGDRAVIRQTIPSPSQFFTELIRAENEEYVNRIYPHREDLYTDLITAYRDFIYTLYNEGCRNLQIDDCTWGMLCDSSFVAYFKNGEEDAQLLQDLYLRLNNAVLADLPKDLIINTHVCRGNYASTWAGSGGYAPVSETLFGKENVHGYYLEFDDDRSGDFEPLKEVSDDKVVVLGLVTSKHATLENKATIISRIKEATKYVPLNRLCLSPQCGFASTEEGNLLTEEEQWNKIKLIKEIADEVWG